MKAITNSSIEKYQEAGKKISVSCGTSVAGFRLDVTEKGAARFTLRIDNRKTGKRQSITIAQFGKRDGQVSIQTATKMARTLRARFDNGEDIKAASIPPKAAKAYARKNAPQSGTIGDLIDRYISYKERGGDNAKTTLKHRSRSLGYVRDAHRYTLVEDFTRLEVTALMDEQELIAKSRARHMLAYSRAMWNWALEAGLVNTVNPWANMKERSKRYKIGIRTRILSSDELAVLINGHIPGMRESVRRATLTSLYTHCRPGMATMSDDQAEAKGFDWSEINWKDKTWVVPESRMKGHEDHVTPIVSQFYALLKQWHDADGNPEQGPVTRQLKTDSRYLRSTQYSKEIGHLGVTYRPHDFRRTISTVMQELGIPINVIEISLSHADGGVSGGAGKHYMHYSYAREHREALQSWADHLDTLTGANAHGS